MRYHFQLLLITFFFCAVPAFAQVVLQGKIEYTRKYNVHRQFDDWGDEDSEWMKSWKAKLPKFDSRTFTYFFNTKQSKYSFVKQEENPELGWFSIPGVENQVFTDFSKQQITASKKVFEERFLLQDSMRHFTWKIMEEVRTVAGYSCRKAITKIHDSVVVVAFYTDKIPVSGGPELFSGLPGMIMEIAIPRLYTTWVASSVVLQAAGPADFVIPDKGKKSDPAQVQKTVKEATKNWGKFAEKNIWWSAL